MKIYFILLLILVLIIFFANYIFYRYQTYQEEKEFWQQVEKMEIKHNKIILQALEKTFENMEPFIIDLFKKNNIK